MSNSLDSSELCAKCFRKNCTVNHTSEEVTLVTHLVEGETIEAVVTSGTFGNHVNTVRHHLMNQLQQLPIIEEVFTSKLGAEFHFTNDCKGLRRVTTAVTLVPLDVALAEEMKIVFCT